jgi:2-succinyl-5-enolpyruvyl-6-hydroxy-3-cyclohexene-1-carboxylate synthase
MAPPFPVAVIQAALDVDVREFVVCAGARNSALVVALAAAGEKVRLWQHFEERAAAFFAIGRMRVTGRPVAVVTTSGTAAAELLPAVIEAHYQGLPLVALTADRPRSYRGTGAPQAIEQENLFGSYATFFVDAEDEPVQLAAWNRKGPLHLNVCLSEPDAPSLPLLRAAAGELRNASPPPERDAIFESGRSAPRAELLLMAGELLGEEIADAANAALQLGALVDAEAASGLRDEPALKDRLIRCGEATLRHLPVKHIFRFGGVPSNRYWRDLEDQPEIKVVHHSRSGYPGLARSSGVNPMPGAFTIPEPETVHPVEEFMARDAALAARLEALLAAHPSSETGLVRLLSECIPIQATVFTGNSLAVREWNLCAAWGRGHRVHVLRGANGIDGNLSAFLGIAADKAEAWCVTGDLTALYDLAAPWMLPQLPAGRRRFVVIQNGGGKIFSRLPSLRGLTDRERSLMENPHHINLKPWASMWGMDHTSGGAELLQDPAPIEALSDHAVIELYPDAAQTEAFWKAWHQAEKEVWA